MFTPALFNYSPPSTTKPFFLACWCAPLSVSICSCSVSLYLGGFHTKSYESYCPTLKEARPSLSLSLANPTSAYLYLFLTHRYMYSYFVNDEIMIRTRPDTRHKMRLVCVLFLFEDNTGHTDLRTDGRTDGHDLLQRCDGASKKTKSLYYRWNFVHCSQPVRLSVCYT